VTLRLGEGPAVLSQMERILRFFVGVHLADRDPETARRARLVVYFALIIAACGVSYGALYGWLGMPVAVLGAIGAIVIPLVTAFLYRASASPAVAGHGMALACAAALVGVVLATGSLDSPALTWFCLCPITATMLTGRRAGALWLGLAIAFIAFLFAAHGAPFMPASEMPEFFETFYRFAVPSGLLAALFAIAWSYESAKNDALGRERAINVELSHARDAAEAARRRARLVLDNVDQGLAMIELDGTIGEERSVAMDRWFDSPKSGARLWELFDGNAAEWLRFGWGELTNDAMPLELALEQIPSRFDRGGRAFRFEYRPVIENGAPSRVLLVATDVTRAEEAARIEVQQREMLALFLKLSSDLTSVLEFVDEARSIVKSLREPASEAEEKRLIHTLKGTSSLYGLGTLTSWLHRLEDQLAESQSRCTPEQIGALEAQWAEVERMLEPFLEQHHREHIVVDRQTFERGIALALAHAKSPELVHHLRRWEWSPVGGRLRTLAERARAFAERSGKGSVRVRVEADEARVPPDQRWRSFFGSIVHVVRNALDHGIESTGERTTTGKEGAGELVLRAQCTGDKGLVIELSDDGRGIRWDAVARKAEALGLPSRTHEDRLEALFTSGFSTADEITELSGRGVGLAAVRDACAELGGRIEVISEPGLGTRFRFLFDETDARDPRSDLAA
jgi:signal transduction histidine kinase